MKLPTYEQQNEWIRAYIVPLFDLNFAKIARNYRMRQDKPFTDERMAQIREDVLAEVREELDFAERIGEPLGDHGWDETYRGNGEVRIVERRSYDGGRVRLAPLKMEFIKRDPKRSVDPADLAALLSQIRSDPVYKSGINWYGDFLSGNQKSWHS